MILVCTCTVRHVSFPTLSTLKKRRGRSKMRQTRKDGKSEGEAISRVEKKHYRTVCPTVKNPTVVLKTNKFDVPKVMSRVV